MDPCYGCHRDWCVCITLEPAPTDARYELEIAKSDEENEVLRNENERLKTKVNRAWDQLNLWDNCTGCYKDECDKCFERVLRALNELEAGGA